MAAAVLVTGNNFEKVSLFSKCLNLNFVSQSTFTRIQTNYILPNTKELWGRMKEKIWNLYKRENLVTGVCVGMVGWIPLASVQSIASM